MQKRGFVVCGSRQPPLPCAGFAPGPDRDRTGAPFPLIPAPQGSAGRGAQGQGRQGRESEDRGSIQVSEDPSESGAAAGEARIAELRAQVDAVDDAILGQLNRRAQLVQLIGSAKQTSGSPTFSAGRERAIVERLAAGNAGPFPQAGLAPVFREIVSATRSLEEVLRIAFLGPEATHSHVAAREQFGALAHYLPQASLADVFAAVAKGEASLGVVPVENTTEGVVAETLDRLAGFEGRIAGELKLRIRNHLLSRSGERARVRRVVSHPQPLAQCRQWLERNLPGIERVEAASTAAAARLAAEDDALAAIGSPLAAECYGLATLAASIEDRADNTTRFLLIGSSEAAPTGRDRTSIVCTLPRDESGGLLRLLEPFARSRVNLTSIQLRPIQDKPWEYFFFLDLEGHAEDPAVAEALAGAARVANSLRRLGSYPRADAPRGGGA